MSVRSIVSASYGDRVVTGMVVDELTEGPGGLSVVLSADGSLYTVYNAGIIEAGETDAFGRGYDIDVEDVRTQCVELLQKGSVVNAIRRIHRKHEVPNGPGRGVLEAWELPMKLCISHERPNELSPQLVRYLDAPKSQRSRIERAMAYLKLHHPKQYRVLNACYFGPTPLSWVAKTWGISRQSVWELQNRGINFLEEYGATSEKPDNP